MLFHLSQHSLTSRVNSSNLQFIARFLGEDIIMQKRNIISCCSVTVQNLVNYKPRQTRSLCL